MFNPHPDSINRVAMRLVRRDKVGIMVRPPNESENHTDDGLCYTVFIGFMLGSMDEVRKNCKSRIA
jgi:hypothetical protein